MAQRTGLGGKSTFAGVQGSPPVLLWRSPGVFFRARSPGKYGETEDFL